MVRSTETNTTDDARDGTRAPWMLLVAAIPFAALLGVHFSALRGVREELAELRGVVAQAGPAPRAPDGAPGTGSDGGSGGGNDGDAAGTVHEKLDALRSDFDFIVNDIQRIERKLDDLTSQLENRGHVSRDPPQPPDLDWTEPGLFETARKGAESVGLTLTKDELRAPSKLILKEGLLEYMVVLKGGKEHESLFSIVGNTPAEARRPKDLGIKFSNAIQALGVKRGKAIRFTAAGTEPAQGDTIRIYVEWTTGGKTEIVRAEDLIWHRNENRPMKPGSFVFVGSTFVPGETAGELDFAADLTAECVATYSAPSAIIDNVEKDAQDDTIFLVATPRIPDDVLHCTLIFRTTEIAGVREFPAPGAPEGGGGK